MSGTRAPQVAEVTDGRSPGRRGSEAAGQWGSETMTTGGRRLGAASALVRGLSARPRPGGLGFLAVRRVAAVVGVDERLGTLRRRS
ncbi:hypothetical protein ABZY42_27910 [Streptomyces sp. NPDC006622]|uniref:hypothetical protein n=1 Tax=Streptomyces sp. NPDC006622 TaxID=3155459 RepID=UPI0033B53CEC